MDVIEAVFKKYCSVEVEEGPMDSEWGDAKLFLENAIPNSMKELKYRPVISLEDEKVAQAGDMIEKLPALFPNATELDLSGTVVQRTHVAEICRTLPKLRTLVLSRVKLFEDNDDEILKGSSGSGLSSLIMSQCHAFKYINFSWLHESFPELNELFATQNGIQSCNDCGLNRFLSLRVLDLSKNNIHRWEELDNLGELPCLEKLNLTANPLENISYSSQTDSSNLKFSSLKSLTLSDTKISRWTDVHCLTKFPVLNDIRLKNTQLVFLSNENLDELPEDDAPKAIGGSGSGSGTGIGLGGVGKGKNDVIRSVIISHLPHIVYLNGGVVTKEERVNAERYFIRHCFSFLSSLDTSGSEKTPAERIKALNFDESVTEFVEPYVELVAKHGDLRPLPEINLSCENIVEIYIRQRSRIRESVTKIEIDDNKTVLAVRQIMANKFGAPLKKVLAAEIKVLPVRHFPNHHVMVDEKITYMRIISGFPMPRKLVAADDTSLHVAGVRFGDCLELCM